MPKPISRRSFLSRSATASATVSGALAGTPPQNASLKAAAPLPIVPYRPTEKQIAAAYERVHGDETRQLPPVLNAALVPHWFGEKDAWLWYRRDGEAGTHTFVLVNTETGQKSAAFDHARLAQSLSQVLGGSPMDASRLPFSAITLSPDLAWVRFVVRGQTYQCDLPSYVCRVIDTPANASAPPPGPPQQSNQSPPTETVFLKNHNVWTRGNGGSGEAALTTDGTSENRLTHCTGRRKGR